MTRAFDGVRDIAHQHTLSITAGIIIAVPGNFFFVTGETLSLSSQLAIASSTSESTPGSPITPLICTVQSPLELAFPTSGPSDTPSASDINQIINSTLQKITSLSLASTSTLGAHLTHHFPSGRLLSVVIVTALPGVARLTIQHLPVSWARRHQTVLVNVVHFIALAACANRKLEASDLVVVVFVMVAFDVFQRSLGGRRADAMTGGESDRQIQGPSSPETASSETQSVLANSDNTLISQTAIVDFGGLGPVSGSSDFDSKDREIVRLQRTLTDSSTASKAKDVQLRNTKRELHSARTALNDTFAEYNSLREQLKNVKKNLGRDHQAVVYRKDIELFALRKGNEQKERYIEERNSQLEEMARQHKAATELKDAQLKLFKEKLILMERQSSPKCGQEAEEGDHALEVRILKVRKGRTSLDMEEDKDVIISKLQQQLAAMNSTNEEVVNQQAELQRAWDIAKKIQKALKEEREKHTQTKEQLQETTVKLSEAQPTRDRANSMPGRLPTISEDDDKNELENMFDTAQHDNLRLYAEVAALERRLGDANKKMFTAISDAEAIREQLRLEKAVNEDMETARPSVVHRVHFQRMEGQLNSVHDALRSKDEEMDLLRNTIAEKDHYVNDLKAEVDAAVKFHTEDQDEIERLKGVVEELKATKQQLMLDHERLALHRTRQRVISADRPDRTSARSSSATLIQAPELSPPLPLTMPEPETETETEAVGALPVLEEREGSIQQTPKRHLRSKSEKVYPDRNRWSLMSLDVPPPELRDSSKQNKRRSWGVRMVQKIVRKEDREQSFPSSDADATTTKEERKEERPVTRRETIRRALGTSTLGLGMKDKNTSIRPSTAAPAPTLVNPLSLNPLTPTASPRAPNARRRSPSTPRYYATQSTTDLAERRKEVERPMTSRGAGNGGKRESGSWGATNKLKRRSLM